MSSNSQENNNMVGLSEPNNLMKDYKDDVDKFEPADEDENVPPMLSPSMKTGGKRHRRKTMKKMKKMSKRKMAKWCKSKKNRRTKAGRKMCKK